MGAESGHSYGMRSATAKFRGRQWTAWYADIAVSAGPWKFAGLPGLILRVVSADKEHEFTAISIRKVKSPIIREKKSVVRTTRDKFNRNEKEYKSAPGQYMAGSLDMIVKLTGHVDVVKRDMLRQQHLYGVKNMECLVDFHLQKDFCNNRILCHAHVGYDYSGQSVRLGETEEEGGMDRWSFQANLSVFPLKALELYASGIGTLVEQPDGGYRRNAYANAGMRWIQPSYEIELSLSNLTNEDTYSVCRTVLSDTFYYQYSLRPCEGALTFRYNF